MPKTPVYNAKGELVGSYEVPAEVFGVTPLVDLVHQVVVAERANERNVVAHTKTRGEVRGGGRKPWKQKGTGNARAGSIRSPLWRKGGVTFGPRSDRNYRKKINRQMFRKAVAMVFSQKLNDQQLIAVEGLPGEVTKTKELRSILEGIRQGAHLQGKCLAVISNQGGSALEKSVRNLPTVEFLTIKDVSPYRLLKANDVIVLKDALPQLTQWLHKRAA